jgi:hypothetical protein
MLMIQAGPNIAAKIAGITRPKMSSHCIAKLTGADLPFVSRGTRRKKSENRANARIAVAVQKKLRESLCLRLSARHRRI